MKSEQVDITEGFHETFRIHIVWRIVATVLCLLVIEPYVLLMAVVIICFRHLFTLVFLSIPILLMALVLVCVWRTRVGVSSQGIGCWTSGTMGERFVSWNHIVGVKRLLFGEIHILVTGDRPLRMGLVAGTERIAQLVEAKLGESRRRDRRSPRVSAVEWIARVVLPLMVITSVLGFITVLVIHWLF